MLPRQNPSPRVSLAKSTLPVHALTVTFLPKAMTAPMDPKRIPGERFRKRLTWPDRALRCMLRPGDRKSTRLNSSHGSISYAVFCLKKKKMKAGMVVEESEEMHERHNAR